MTASPSSNLSMSSNGIDTSEFDPSLVSEDTKQQMRRDLGIGEDDFVFLFVGRIVNDKGINELVSAFNIMSEEFDNIRLVLVGGIKDDDPITVKTKELIESNDSIISVGTQRNVVSFYAISDVFVFPSYREGFPNVVLEASAMELPSIVTDINGSNEIIEDGSNGIIVPVKNSKAILDAMIQIYTTDGMIKDLKANTRQRIKKLYEREFVRDELLNEYNKMLGIKTNNTTND